MVGVDQILSWPDVSNARMIFDSAPHGSLRTHRDPPRSTQMSEHAQGAPAEDPLLVVWDSGMRILHVVPTYLPAVRYGGPIFAVHGLCRALARRGHHVEVFTTNVDGSGASPVPLGEPVDLDGVQIRYFS